MAQGIQVRNSSNRVIIDTAHRLPILKLSTTISLTTSGSAVTATEPGTWMGQNVYAATSGPVYWGIDTTAAEFELLITDLNVPSNTTSLIGNMRKVYVLRDFPGSFKLKLETQVWASASFRVKGFRY